MVRGGLCAKAGVGDIAGSKHRLKSVGRVPDQAGVFSTVLKMQGLQESGARCQEPAQSAVSWF
jgi:hypothetical protein